MNENDLQTNRVLGANPTPPRPLFALFLETTSPKIKNKSFLLFHKLDQNSLADFKFYQKTLFV